MVGVIKLERCEVCRGKGKIRGIFHAMECASCNGGGLTKVGGGALEYPVLVEQLRLRLAQSGRVRRLQQAELERLGRWPLRGVADEYGKSNQRGAYGANRTGD